jgi:uncharacterized iron-regulated membrane protein
MRYWHRLCAPIFAALLLIISLTGVITRVVQTIDHASAHADHGAKHGGEHHGKGGDKGATPINAACAQDGDTKTKDQPARTPLAEFGHVVKDIHSGEALGPLGTVLSIASGLALAFFSVSGFWMYVQMWRRRRRSRG